MYVGRRSLQTSYDASGGGGLLKPSECRHMREEGLAKSLYNFYSGWKSSIHSSSCSIYGLWWRGWL